MINKAQKLIRDDRNLYHAQDLSVLWGVENKNTLYTTIKRYIRKGFLYKVHKGLYSTKPVEQIDPVELGLVALRRWGYLSTETVLSNQGVILQEVKYITLISDVSKKFTIAGNSYRVRKMKEDFLHNEEGITDKRASLERAVADILYYNPSYCFDNSAKINWTKVREIKDKVGYNYDINR